MSEPGPVITIDFGKKCSRCVQKGAAENGLCLRCITKRLTEMPRANAKARGGIRCPVCNGTGELSMVVVFASPPREVSCWFCKGGTVSEERAHLYVRGRIKKGEREARGVSLEDEARRFGITTKQLHALEHGMLNPKAFSIEW